MYCPDTLQRLNDAAVEKYQAEVEAQSAKVEALAEEEGVLLEELATGAVRDLFEGDGGYAECDYCREPAIHAFPVYNPADAVREPPVEGAYDIARVCGACYHDGTYLEDRFYCDHCGKLFAFNHSWDVLAVVDRESGEVFCQKCYAEHELEPVSLGELQEKLAAGETGDWKRLDRVPGKTLLVELEFSQYSDFPGCNSTGCVSEELQRAAEEAGLGPEDEVYPVVTAGRQFHEELGVFY